MVGIAEDSVRFAHSGPSPCPCPEVDTPPQPLKSFLDTPLLLLYYSSISGCYTILRLSCSTRFVFRHSEGVLHAGGT